VAKPDGKKRVKGADATPAAKPARDRAERGGKRQTARDGDGAVATAPEPDAPHEHEAETEDRE
jgi:hypothetical protein